MKCICCNINNILNTSMFFCQPCKFIIHATYTDEDILSFDEEYIQSIIPHLKFLDPERATRIKAVIFNNKLNDVLK